MPAKKVTINLAPAGSLSATATDMATNTFAFRFDSASRIAWERALSEFFGYDDDYLDRYRERIRAIVEQFGGRYLFIGGRFEVVEGEWHPTFPILIEFPSLADAHRWYDSDEFRELKEVRLRALRSDAVFMEGLMDGFR